MIVPGVVITAGWWIGGSNQDNFANRPAGTTPSSTSPEVSLRPPSSALTVDYARAADVQSDRRWWQRPSPAERKANRERMAKESASAAMTAGSIAWFILSPNKFSKALNLAMRLGAGTANSVEDQQTGQSRFYDSDPQG